MTFGYLLLIYLCDQTKAFKVTDTKQAHKKAPISQGFIFLVNKFIS